MTESTPEVPSGGLTARLDAGPPICAEGFLFELERRGYLSAGEFVPEVALEYPDALRTVHVDFQRAGSDVVEAFTYNGHRGRMRVIGKEDLLEPLNRAALQIAREVADQRPGDLLAGNISNSNIWDPADTARQADVRGMFEEMVGWAVEGGADMIIGETFYYAGEALAALEVAKATGLPVVIAIAPMALEAMADGVGIVETCPRLEQAGSPPTRADSPRTWPTTSCTATTSGYPSTSSRSATRPSCQTPEPAHRPFNPSQRRSARWAGHRTSIASLPDVTRMGRDRRQPALGRALRVGVER